MSALFRWTLTLVAAALAAQGALAQDTPVKGGVQGVGRNHFEVRPTTARIRVDGVLDEEAWANATVIPLPYEWYPGDNVAPPVRTECLVTFDNENLYVAFRAYDPEPGQIRAYLADRDTALKDDTVGFQIDTFNDHRRAFEFRINPLGVQLDATVSDVDSSEDFTWDAIWASAGRITADGYVVEVALPLKQLRFPRTGDVQTWGFLASRDYPRSVDHQIRSTPIDRGLNCNVCQFDALTGFQHIQAGNNVELVPTVTAKRNDTRPTLDAPPETGKTKIDPGLSLRWGITPNVTLNATLNPDFSQVEADAAQLNVNETFALFYPEKRPFFLEGADYFATPYNAVFTRTVANPKAGVKLTGKEGPNAFGVFLADDRINNLIFPGNESSSSQTVDQEVQSGVLRYRRDVGARSTLGALFTGRTADGYHNYLYGFDGSLGVTKADRVRFQALGTQTAYPAEVIAANEGDPRVPSGSFDGFGHRVDYSHATRDWNWTLSENTLNPKFRADYGFIPQVDIRDYEGTLLRTIWGEPGGWFSQLQLFAAAGEVQNYKGETTRRRGDLVLAYFGALQSDVELGLRPNVIETFQGKRYNDFRQDLTVTLRPSGNLGLGLYVRHGDAIDFANNRQAQFLLTQPSLSFQIGRHISGSLDYTHQTFEFKGDRYLRADLAQTTLRYHLSVRAFFRAIVQYRDVQRDLASYNHPEFFAGREKNLLGQFLFSYKLNPQTVLLVGYSNLSQGLDQIDLRATDRAYFLKIGYALLW
jgi:Domain of unknown function (DUF5916)/Carbohydrate family 9 binding domain-like